MVLPNTKSGRGRNNPLPVEVADELKKLKARSRSEWVFPGNEVGKPICNITKAFKRTPKRAGLDDMRIHDLRHTYASNSAMFGVSLYQIQVILGHSSPKMTERYAHFSDDALRRGQSVVANAVFGTGSAASGGIGDRQPS